MKLTTREIKCLIEMKNDTDSGQSYTMMPTTCADLQKKGLALQKTIRCRYSMAYFEITEAGREALAVQNT